MRSGLRYGPSAVARWAAPSKRFVIVTIGRTGSELLVDLLNSHPDITCRSELLAEGPRWPHAYLRAQAATAGLRGAKAFGWKLLIGQFRDDPRLARDGGYLTRLAGEGYRIVLLDRRDHLQQTISWHRAELTDYHHRRGEKPEFAPTAIDPESLLHWTRVNEEASAFLRRSVEGLPHIGLVYEDDLLDAGTHQATVDRVCAYLDLAGAPVSSRLVKVTPRRTQDMVSNWDEITEHFTRSGAANLLGEARAAAPGGAA